MLHTVIFVNNVWKNIPVSCDFYDQLEALSVLRTACEIVFLEQESKAAVHGRIVDLYVKEKAEFLKLNNGMEIRLNKLIHVNGVTPSGTC